MASLPPMDVAATFPGVNPTLLSLAAPVVALLAVIVGGGGVLTWGRSARLRAAVIKTMKMSEALPVGSTERYNMEVLARARARQLLSEQGPQARAQACRLHWQVFLVTAGLYFMVVALALQTPYNDDETLHRALIGLAGILGGGIWWAFTKRTAPRRRAAALDPSGTMGGKLDPTQDF